MFSSGAAVEQPEKTYLVAAVAGWSCRANSSRATLVTGVAGFVGQAVCSDLSARGYWVLRVIRRQEKAHQHLMCNTKS